MNLSRIKKVAFIPNFNKREGYPNVVSVAVVAEKKVITPKIKRFKLGNPDLIAAKKEFNKTKPIGYKPVVLVSTKF